METIVGTIVTPSEDIQTLTTIKGTRVLSMSYTFQAARTAEEVINLSCLRSFVGSSLFDGPVMSTDGKTAMFTRKVGV